MDITINKKNPIEASIKITLKEPDYQPKVEEKVKDYSKKANIKGFRPGKVPSSLIRKMYGKSILIEEINHLVTHSLNDYIKENNLKIIGEPLPDKEKALAIDWDNQKEFEFEYSIGLVDDFKYEISKNVKAKSYQIEVDNDTLNESIDKLRMQFGNMTNPEKSIESDFLYGNFKEIDGDFEKDGLIKIEDINKSDRKNFIGKGNGDEIKFDIKKSLDSENITKVLGIDKNEFENLGNEFLFTVKNVNRQEPAELNQELFDKGLGAGKAKTETEFKQQVKELIRENYQREANYLTDIEIKDSLINQTKINLPDSFLKEWLMVTNEGKISKDEIDNEYDEYAKELKWNLIKNKIADDNNTKVEHKEIIDRAKAMIKAQFAGSGIDNPPEENLQAFADNYLQSENGANYMKLMNQMKSERIFEYIKGNITLQDKKIKASELQKLAEK